jgi:colanic acid biosynthesis glycosyl transferase WcaI
MRAAATTVQPGASAMDGDRLRVALWSYNYDPEPTGIAPLSATLARALAELGHEVEVVAAHPHYPEPRWGVRLRPYREHRDGIPVLRMPIWPGRGGVAQRIRQELSFAAPLAAATPFLRRPDVMVAVSPSFPALAPAIAYSRMHRVPWVMWLQDILPDGATASGLVRGGRMIEAARRFERFAYRSAARVVVISDSFRENLSAKGVPDEKMVRLYNPASLPIRETPRPEGDIDPALVLNMGNIGRTQNLEAVTRAFEASAELERAGARFVMAGDGVAAADVRREIASGRVEITGVLEREPLERLLAAAAVGLVSQSYDGIDFNVPSKLMNFMGRGVPVLAAVRPESEVARIVERSGGGWVTKDPEEAMSTLARVLADPAARDRAATAALDFAQANFTPTGLAEGFEHVLRTAARSRRRR